MAEDEKKVADQYETLAKSLIKSTSGLAAFSATLALTKPGLDDFGKLAEVVPGIGSGLKAMLGVLSKQTQAFQALSSSGMTFDGNLQDMVQSATAAGMTLDQLQSFTSSNSQSFAMLGASMGKFGSTVESGGNAFLDATAAFYQDKRLSQGLRNLGMSFEEINDNLMMNARISAFTGRVDQRSAAQRNASAAEFAEELQIIAKLTGKQADELQAEMAARQREGDYRAMMLQKTPEQMAAIEKAMAQADAAGFGDLLKDYLIRGFPSKDQAMVAGMSGDMVQLFENMTTNLEGGASGLAEFNKQTDQISGVAAKTVSDPSFLAIASLGDLNSASAAASRTLSLMGEAQFGVIAIQREAAAEGRQITVEEAKKLAEERIAAAREDQDTLKENATEGGKALTQAMLRAEEALMDTAIAVQKTATNDFYNMLSNEADGFIKSLQSAGVKIGTLADQISTGLGGIFGDDATFQGNQKLEILALANELEKRNPDDPAANEKMDALATNINALVTQIESEGSQSKREDLLKTLKVAIQTGMQELKADDPDESFSTPSGFETPKLSTGTFGELGTAFANFGNETIAALHGTEMVATPDQVDKLLSGSYNMGLTSATNELKMLTKSGNNMAKTDVIQVGDMLETGFATVSSGLSKAAPSIDDGMKSLVSNNASTMQGMISNMRPAVESVNTEMQKIDLSGIADSIKTALPMDKLFGDLKVSMDGVKTSVDMTGSKQISNQAKQLRQGKNMLGDLTRGTGI